MHDATSKGTPRGALLFNEVLKSYHSFFVSSDALPFVYVL
jgi:hypothetical protein